MLNYCVAIKGEKSYNTFKENNFTKGDNMGNRAIIILKGRQNEQEDSKKVVKSYYMHWNGGLDTWLPVAKACFDNGIFSPELIQSIFEKNGIRMEENPLEDCFDWVEENGQHTIDLNYKRFSHKQEIFNEQYESLGFETKEYNQEDLAPLFDSYIKETFKPEYAEKSKEQWESFYNEFNINGAA